MIAFSSRLLKQKQIERERIEENRYPPELVGLWSNKRIKSTDTVKEADGHQARESKTTSPHTHGEKRQLKLTGRRQTN